MILTVYCTCMQCITIICICAAWKNKYISCIVLSYLIVLQSDPGDESDASPACSGSPAELTGQSGEFGISKSQYKDNLQCGWKITVEAGKVIKGSVPPVFIL